MTDTWTLNDDAAGGRKPGDLPISEVHKALLGPDPTTTDPTAPGEPFDEAAATRAEYYARLCHRTGNSHAPDVVKAAHASADDVPLLLAEVRRQRAELARIRRAWMKMQAFRDKNADGMIAEIMRLRAELDPKSDPGHADRCGLGRPHEPHQSSIGRCLGLTADAYRARLGRDQRYEQVLSVCTTWSPNSGCCCRELLGSVDHGPVATPAEVFA